MNAGEILLIEDHPDIAEMVADYLRSCGYAVTSASNGVDGLELGAAKHFDAIILDLMLPGLDGLDVCQSLRQRDRADVPIIMLTARDTLEDKLAGFNHGADDYLIKPFDVEELAARIKALIARSERHSTARKLEIGGLSLDLATMRIERDGQAITLAPIGMRILQLLIRESPKVVQRHEIEREIWGDLPPDSDALRSHMYNLRKAIDKPFKRPLIHTVHNTGFRIADEHASE